MYAGVVLVQLRVVAAGDPPHFQTGKLVGHSFFLLLPLVGGGIF
jgi:hypothetical protein